MLAHVAEEHRRAVAPCRSVCQLNDDVALLAVPSRSDTPSKPTLRAQLPSVIAAERLVWLKHASPPPARPLIARGHPRASRGGAGLGPAT